MRRLGHNLDKLWIRKTDTVIAQNKNKKRRYRLGGYLSTTDQLSGRSQNLMEGKGHMTIAREMIKRRDSPVGGKELERENQQGRV